jgi:hypothetical protein
MVFTMRIPGPSIALGHGLLLCPHCEVSDSMAGFKALRLNEKYKHDLNPVYKHSACGHVFSPGDPWIIAAYLAGELVPREMLVSLRETVEGLHAVVAQLKLDGERRHAES